MYTQNYEHFKRLVLDSPDSEAEYIDGFDFEWGYYYTLKVKEKKVGPLSDGTRYDYFLLKVISKEKVAEPAQTEAVASKAPQSRERNQDGLPVAGEKVNEILSSTNFSLDPTGVRLSDDAAEEEIEIPNLDNLSIAPVGSDLASKKEELPVALPDTSHLSVEPHGH